MKKNDNIYLLHILDSISKIEQYLKGIDKEGYGVDTELVWETAKNDIPFIKSEIRKIVESLD